MISIFSIVLALFAVLCAILGANAELFVCRPLYDAPDYQGELCVFIRSPRMHINTFPSVFSKLLDQPGLVNETVDEIIGGVSDLPHKMNACERNEATARVFQLNRMVNFSEILDLQAYAELDDEIQQIFVSPKSSFGTLTDPLDAILAHMFTISEISVTAYRTELSSEETQKDLSAFVEQMQRISVHTDTVTSSRMSSLGNRARRVLANVLQVRTNTQ